MEGIECGLEATMPMNLAHLTSALKLIRGLWHNGAGTVSLRLSGLRLDFAVE